MIAGNASSASVTIEMIRSTQPRKYPAIMPSVVPDDEADDDARDGDDQRDAGAVHAAGEHVAPEAVGAEPEVVAGAEAVVRRPPAPAGRGAG